MVARIPGGGRAIDLASRVGHDARLVLMQREAVRAQAALMQASSVYDAAQAHPGNETVARLRAAYFRGL